MAYTAATAVPTLSEINFIQFSTPTNPRVRLAAPISDITTTTLTFTSAILDHTGAVPTQALIIGVEDSVSKFVEQIKIPAGGLSVDGKTATGCIRGLYLEGLDWTTGSTANAHTLGPDSKVFCSIAPVIQVLNTAGLTAQIGANIKFNGRPLFMGAAVQAVPVFANAAARDAAIAAPQNGDMCYLTDIGNFFDYQGGAWAARASGVTSNASTTVSGKVEIATQAQHDAGTSTGETGALLASTPGVIQAGIQKGSQLYAVTAGGTTTFTATLTPAIASYINGMTVRLKFNVAPTGASTINLNGLGAVAIKKLNDQGIASGDIKANQIVELTYNSTGPVFQMQSQVAVQYLTDVQIFTTDGTWTKPTGAKSVEVVLVGSGGGGGGGAFGNINNEKGGGGGGGGAVVIGTFPASILGATETVTVPAGGSGGAGTGIIGSGSGGNNGASSSFGTWLTAGGGGGGAAGVMGGSGVAGGGGGGSLGSAAGATGGEPSLAAGTNAISGQGPSGSTSTVNNAEFGGGTGGRSASGGGSSIYAAGGGGGGGNSNGVGNSTGGNGGTTDSYTIEGGGAGGNGVAGSAGASNTTLKKRYGGSGGGGGGGNGSTVGGAGGAGGVPGGGGGGGGSGSNTGGGTSSGAGGTGGRGEVKVITYF